MSISGRLRQTTSTVAWNTSGYFVLRSPSELDCEAIRHAYWLRLAAHRPQSLEPNPLPILARAVNGLRLGCRSLNQPRWKAGRWRSKT